MKYFYVYHVDEIKPPKKSLDDEDAPKWPFYIVVSGRSNTGKTNMQLNLFNGDKYYDLKEGKKKIGERFIRCNDLVLVGHYINEPKWKLVRNFYKKIADRSKPYYEDVIVFDTTVPISDPMSIRVGWMNPLDLEKEIKSLTA